MQPEVVTVALMLIVSSLMLIGGLCAIVILFANRK
jgi:hypothetical protein